MGAPPNLAITKLTETIEKLSLKVDGLGKNKPAEKLVGLVDRYSGTDKSYQKVVSWIVGQTWEKERGRLDEVSMNSDNYTKTRFRLTVEGKIFFRDLQLQSALTLPFGHPNELRRGEEVKIECKSSDGTAIVVTATITGREF